MQQIVITPNFAILLRLIYMIRSGIKNVTWYAVGTLDLSLIFQVITPYHASMKLHIAARFNRTILSYKYAEYLRWFIYMITTKNQILRVNTTFVIRYNN